MVDINEKPKEMIKIIQENAKYLKGLVHGDYGKTPAPIKPEFTKKILGDEQPITCRFADTLAPEMDKLKAEAAKWATQEEDVLTYAMFPQVAPKFFDKRNAKKQGVDGDHVDYAKGQHIVPLRKFRKALGSNFSHRGSLLLLWQYPNAAHIHFYPL